MELEKLSLFSVAKKRLAWLSRRQEVIAQNIANADTPEYRARDLKPLTFRDLVRSRNTGTGMKVTNARHLKGIAKRASEFSEGEIRKPFETSPSGNSVILEEQMAKLNETSIGHRLTTELYKKNLNLIRMALGRR
ncbi:MAG: flagellar basal body rod protein FlgB [Proteobacteria bacterium]|nr:flagellar basal body rod protein FlgB [Pseudomonadota bacterium]